MAKITAVCFDLGQVLLGFSRAKQIQSIADVLRVSAPAVEAALTNEEWQDRYEHGQISSEVFFRRLKSLATAEHRYDYDALTNAFTDIFTEIPDMISVLDRLRAAGRRLVLVSNTNDAHIALARRTYAGLGRMHAQICSHEIGVMKPSPSFYEHAARAAQCAPENAIFIDDLPANIEGARRFGFNVILFKNPADCERDLAKEGAFDPFD